MDIKRIKNKVFYAIVICLGIVILWLKTPNWIHNNVLDKAEGLNDKDLIESEINKMNFAIHLRPSMYPFYLTRAKLNIKVKKYREAISDLQVVNRLETEQADAFTTQAMIYDWTGNYDSATLYYKMAIERTEKLMLSEKDSIKIRRYKEHLILLGLMKNDTISLVSETADSTKFDMMKMVLKRNKKEILKEVFQK